VRSTGMTRKVDSLGRVVLPAEMRRVFGIREGDLVDIAVDGVNIVLTKVEQRCVFCGDSTSLVEFSGKLVCEGCVAGLRDARAPGTAE
jgi:AbrB family transcriptional regulator, transcriptional pleiotropic regulator of transition state genes